MDIKFEDAYNLVKSCRIHILNGDKTSSSEIGFAEKLYACCVAFINVCDKYGIVDEYEDIRDIG